jgi:hypothetical protein
MHVDPAQIPSDLKEPAMESPWAPVAPPQVRAAEIIAAALRDVARSIDKLAEAVKQ